MAAAFQPHLFISPCEAVTSKRSQVGAAGPAAPIKRAVESQGCVGVPDGLKLLD